VELNRLFDLVEEIPEKAAVEAVFGPPTQVDDKTIIPIGRISYAFGLGFGQGWAAPTPSPEDPETAESVEGDVARDSGGIGGGGLSVQPLAVLEVTPEATALKPIVDEGKIARLTELVGAWIVFWLAQALIKIFGKK
jgi:uncharacterized spore protein YtfJ